MLLTAKFWRLLPLKWVPKSKQIRKRNRIGNFWRTRYRSCWCSRKKRSSTSNNPSPNWELWSQKSHCCLGTPMAGTSTGRQASRSWHGRSLLIRSCLHSCLRQRRCSHSGWSCLEGFRWLSHFLTWSCSSTSWSPSSPRFPTMTNCRSVTCWSRSL